MGGIGWGKSVTVLEFFFVVKWVLWVCLICGLMCSYLLCCSVDTGDHYVAIGHVLSCMYLFICKLEINYKRMVITYFVTVLFMILYTYSVFCGRFLGPALVIAVHY
jgi:multisubunit Na+/H+ antiporter MnhF subunit